VNIGVLRGLTATLLAAIVGALCVSAVFVSAVIADPEGPPVTSEGAMQWFVVSMTFLTPLIFIFGAVLGVPAYLLIRRRGPISLFGLLALGAVMGAVASLVLLTGSAGSTPIITMGCGIAAGLGAAMVWWLLIEKRSHNPISSPV